MDFSAGLGVKSAGYSPNRNIFSILCSVEGVYLSAVRSDQHRQEALDIVGGGLGDG